MLHGERVASARIGVSLLVTLVAMCMGGEALAGRSQHLDYAPSSGVALPAPNPDRASVVFLRPQSAGGSTHASVYDGEKFLSFVQTDTCFVYEAEPGEHRFMVVSEAADFLDADLQAGKLYFIQVKPRMGAWRVRFSLFPLTESAEDWAKLPGWLRWAYLVKPNRSASTWFESSRESVLSKKAKYLPEWEAKPPAARPRLKPDDGVTGL